MVALNFGLVKIDWDLKQVILKTVGIDGNTACEQYVSLGELMADGVTL